RLDAALWNLDAGTIHYTIEKSTNSLRALKNQLREEDSRCEDSFDDDADTSPSDDEADDGE
ncbi:unnamed protein product, partial [Aphanomyces euteiches]